GIPTHRQSRWPVGFLFMAARNRRCFFVRIHGDLIRISWRCRGQFGYRFGQKSRFSAKKFGGDAEVDEAAACKAAKVGSSPTVTSIHFRFGAYRALPGAPGAGDSPAEDSSG